MGCLIPQYNSPAVVGEPIRIQLRKPNIRFSTNEFRLDTHNFLVAARRCESVRKVCVDTPALVRPDLAVRAVRPIVWRQLL